MSRWDQHADGTGESLEKRPASASGFLRGWFYCKLHGVLTRHHGAQAFAEDPVARALRTAAVPTPSPSGAGTLPCTLSGFPVDVKEIWVN